MRDRKVQRQKRAHNNEGAINTNVGINHKNHRPLGSPGVGDAGGERESSAKGSVSCAAIFTLTSKEVSFNWREGGGDATGQCSALSS